jgi:uncharacterized protein YndB with AHSA1/START domain
MSCNRGPAGDDVERTLDLPAPSEEVWSELVSGAWLGDDVEIDARPGGALRVDDKFGVVERADPPRRLSFSWTDPDGREPPSRVDLELLPLGAGTRVRVRESRLFVDHTSFARRPRALARA